MPGCSGVLTDGMCRQCGIVAGQKHAEKYARAKQEGLHLNVRIVRYLRSCSPASLVRVPGISFSFKTTATIHLQERGSPASTCQKQLLVKARQKRNSARHRQDKKSGPTCPHAPPPPSCRPKVRPCEAACWDCGARASRQTLPKMCQPSDRWISTNLYATKFILAGMGQPSAKLASDSKFARRMAWSAI